MGKLRLWIDTDVGTNPDDAVALLVAAAHPEAELVGVSVTGDERGRRAALAEALVPGVLVVGRQGAGEVAEAVEAAAPEAVLAIGPLTNVAAALPVLGDVPLTVMGGAVEPVWHRGRWREVETNFGGDPEATAAVLAGASRLTVVPLDVTVGTAVDQDGLRRLVAVAPALAEHVAAWLEPALHLHDPTALLIAVGEAAAIGAVIERCRISVDGLGRVTVGRRGQNGHNLVTSIDGGAVRERVEHILAPET